MNTDRLASTMRRAPVMLPVALCLLLVCVSSGAAMPAYEHHVKLTPENSVIGNYPADKKPILTVKSGATVRIDGGGGNRWGDEEPMSWIAKQGIKLTAEETIAIREIERVVKETPRQAGIQSGHLIVGPIAIEGAMPGDTLEVRIKSVVPRIPYGTVGGRPGRGGIPDDVKEPFSFVVSFDAKRTIGQFSPDIAVPLAPFQGVMGTLPAASEGPNRRSGPPGLFGGNLDCKELVDGTTLFLPVFHPGALFYTGDSHAAQGDGEITVNAIETANTSVLQFILHKNTGLKVPRAETPTHYISFGLDPDLDNAMTMAIRETNSFLAEAKQLPFERAFALGSIGIDFRVTQVVDDTKGIHAMIPKSLFLKDKTPFWAPAPKGR
jgi:acetamidase/formamidase